MDLWKLDFARYRRFSILMCVLLAVSLLFPSLQTGRAAASALPATAAVGQNITSWMADESRNMIYAVTDDTDKLLFIGLDDLQIKKEILLGGDPSDLELDGSLLYIPLSGAAQIKVVDVDQQAVTDAYSTAGSRAPYRVAVDNGKLYYVLKDNFSNIYAISLTTRVDTAIGTATYYMPELEADRATHTLYIGESGSSGSNMLTMNTTNDTLLSNVTTYDDGYGFSYPDRRFILNADGAYYAGRKLDKNNLANIDGEYQDGSKSYDSKITFVKGDTVLTEDAVYHKTLFVKLAALPFSTKLSLMDAENNVLLFKASTKTIERIRLILDLPVSGVSPVTDNRLALNVPVTDMVYSDQTGFLYAISKFSNKLLTIDGTTLQVLSEEYIGSLPADLNLSGGKLYIALYGSNLVAVKADGSTEAPVLLRTEANPYRIAVNAQDLYYLPEYPGSGHRYVYRYQLGSTPSDLGQITYSDAPYRSYYHADIAITDAGKLYLAEKDLSTHRIYGIESDLAGKFKQFGSAYEGNGSYAHGVIVNGSEVYYGGARLRAADLSLYETLNEKVRAVYGDYIIGENTVYRKGNMSANELSSPAFRTPFAINQAAVSSGGRVFLYNDAAKSIYTYANVDEIKVPRTVAQNPVFTDTDPDLGQIGGVLSWGKGENESYILGYSAYYLDETGAKLAKLASVPKSVTSYTYSVTQSTYFPAGAALIGLYSFNEYAESTNSARIPLVDVTGVTPEVDRTAPNAPEIASSIAGDRSIRIEWKKGAESDLAGYRVFLNDVLVKELSPNTVAFGYTGGTLINGTSVAVGLSAFDKAGNESAKTVVTLTPTAPDAICATCGSSTPPESTSPGSTVTPGSTELVISQKTVLPDGRSVTTVTVDPAKLLSSLLELKGETAPVLVIPVQGDAAVAKVELPASVLLEAAGQVPQAVILIQSTEAQYSIPVSLLNIAALASQLGANPADVKVSLSIEKLEGLAANPVQAAATAEGVRLVAGAYEFKLTVQAAGQTQEIGSFGSTYVTRSITVTRTIDPAKTTAVWFNPLTRALSFVPSYFTVANGVTQANIMRTGNSTYTLVEYSKSFADTTDHWAKAEIELLASKLIVKGKSEERFSPEDSITRGELVSLLVRSMGLTQGNGVNTFKDVAQDDWYAADVSAAVQAGLIKGYEDGTFRADRPVTRQEMAVMLAGAMKFGGYKDAVRAENTTLDTFRDRASIAGWAETAAAEAVRAGIIQGLDNGDFAPGQETNRAQSAVMLVRMLKALQFIN